MPSCFFIESVLLNRYDAQYNVQPESIDSVWNIRGVLCNSWHKVKCTIKPKPVKKQRFEHGYAT